MRQQFYQMLLFTEKYETVDINDTKLLPTPAARGPDFEERLREVLDVDQMIEADNAELKEIANKRLPLAARDLSKRDDDLISKMGQLARAIEVDEPPLFGVDMNEEYIIEEHFRADLPTEKRMLVNEIFKILYFNNRDPETYTVSFWADYFNISPSTVRNIVNYMAYPVVNEKTKQVDQVLYFKDTELVQSAQRLLGADSEKLKLLDRDTYLSFLEEDYLQRMAEEHKDESGLFGRIEAPIFAESAQLANEDSSSHTRLENYLSNRLE